MLLCVQQLQLPWVLDWFARELLLLLSVLLRVQQLLLPWVLDWFARGPLLLLSVLLRVQQQRCSCHRCSNGSHSTCCRCGNCGRVLTRDNRSACVELRHVHLAENSLTKLC